MDPAILIIHMVATLFMTGLIWFVQVVHYPLFERVGENRFAGYEREHTTRISYVVAPVMLVELISGSILVWDSPTDIWITNFVLLILTWLSTFLVQMPYHSKLVKLYDKAIVKKLVGSNWVRTVAWTIRSILIIIVLVVSKFS